MAVQKLHQKIGNVDAAEAVADENKILLLLGFQRPNTEFPAVLWMSASRVTFSARSPAKYGIIVLGELQAREGDIM